MVRVAEGLGSAFVAGFIVCSWQGNSNSHFRIVQLFLPGLIPSPKLLNTPPHILYHNYNGRGGGGGWGGILGGRRGYRSGCACLQGLPQEPKAYFLVGSYYENPERTLG